MHAVLNNPFPGHANAEPGAMFVSEPYRQLPPDANPNTAWAARLAIENELTRQRMHPLPTLSTSMAMTHKDIYHPIVHVPAPGDVPWVDPEEGASDEYVNEFYRNQKLAKLRDQLPGVIQWLTSTDIAQHPTIKLCFNALRYERWDANTPERLGYAHDLVYAAKSLRYPKLLTRVARRWMNNPENFRMLCHFAWHCREIFLANSARQIAIDNPNWGSATYTRAVLEVVMWSWLIQNPHAVEMVSPSKLYAFKEDAEHSLKTLNQIWDKVKHDPRIVQIAQAQGAKRLDVFVHMCPRDYAECSPHGVTPLIASGTLHNYITSDDWPTEPHLRRKGQMFGHTIDLTEQTPLPYDINAVVARYLVSHQQSLPFGYRRCDVPTTIANPNPALRSPTTRPNGNPIPGYPEPVSINGGFGHWIGLMDARFYTPDMKEINISEAVVPGSCVADVQGNAFNVTLLRPGLYVAVLARDVENRFLPVYIGGGHPRDYVPTQRTIPSIQTGENMQMYTPALGATQMSHATIPTIGHVNSFGQPISSGPGMVMHATYPSVQQQMPTHSFGYQAPVPTATAQYFARGQDNRFVTISPQQAFQYISQGGQVVDPNGNPVSIVMNHYTGQYELSSSGPVSIQSLVSQNANHQIGASPFVMNNGNNAHGNSSGGAMGFGGGNDRMSVLQQAHTQPQHQFSAPAPTPVPTASWQNHAVQSTPLPTIGVPTPNNQGRPEYQSTSGRIYQDLPPNKSEQFMDAVTQESQAQAAAAIAAAAAGAHWSRVTSGQNANVIVPPAPAPMSAAPAPDAPQPQANNASVPFRASDTMLFEPLVNPDRVRVSYYRENGKLRQAVSPVSREEATKRKSDVLAAGGMLRNGMVDQIVREVGPTGTGLVGLMPIQFEKGPSLDDELSENDKQVLSEIESLGDGVDEDELAKYEAKFDDLTLAQSNPYLEDERIAMVGSVSEGLARAEMMLHGDQDEAPNLRSGVTDVYEFAVFRDKSAIRYAKAMAKATSLSELQDMVNRVREFHASQGVVDVSEKRLIDQINRRATRIINEWLLDCCSIRCGNRFMQPMNDFHSEWCEMHPALGKMGHTFTAMLSSCELELVGRIFSFLDESRHDPLVNSVRPMDSQAPTIVLTDRIIVSATLASSAELGLDVLEAGTAAKAIILEDKNGNQAITAIARRFSNYCTRLEKHLPMVIRTADFRHYRLTVHPESDGAMNAVVMVRELLSV